MCMICRNRMVKSLELSQGPLAAVGVLHGRGGAGRRGGGAPGGAGPLLGVI